ncbi:MAG TPA: hypothetical protein VM364_00590 [Vicinamibacterales bacterium]|nr:hypothetical protein [Vicinamibacterales bacterium]
MKNIQELTQEAVTKITEILKGGGEPYSSVRKEVNTATGLVAYNLEPIARLLQPAYSPLRNRIPRVGNTKGGTAVNWKVIRSLDTAKSAVFTAEGVKAAKVSVTVTDRNAAFKTISLGDEVTFKSQWAGRSFEDVKARTIQRLLKTGIIREEQGILGGRNAALPAVTNPTVAVINGGGTVADATYNVHVRAVGHMPGEGLTAKGRFSAAVSTGAVANGNDSIITASVPYVEGASRYEWYVGVGADANCRLEAVTRINSVAISALKGTGVDVAAVKAADTGNGGDVLAFDGLFAQLDGQFNINKTLPTGVLGTGTQLSLDDVDGVLQNMWDEYRTDPDLISVNSEESIKITQLVLAANGGPTLYVTRNDDQSSVTGGYRVTHYINKATGKAIPIEVHPYQQQGTIGIFTFEMPFSASDIDNPIEIETLQEWMQIDYPPTRPAWDFEVLVDEAVKIYFPGANAVIRNIARRA